MKYLLIAISFLALQVSTYASQSPLNKYKLILNSDQGEEIIKSKLFQTILEDMATNQKRHVEKIKSWDDEKVLKHYGKLNTKETKAESIEPEIVRAKLTRQIVKRSKSMAKQVWSKMQGKSVADLKKELKKTIQLDSINQKEATAKVKKLDEEVAKNPNNAPSSPYYYPNYGSYYNYYGYNYLWNYGNYTYPYYRNYSYQYPGYYNSYYNYNHYNYNTNYYDYYYYPRYNRTVNMLATGLFGVAAVGSFVDWLFDY